MLILIMITPIESTKQITFESLMESMRHRMREANVDSVGFFQGGTVQLVGRWGCTNFPTYDDLLHWIITGKLSPSAQTKFATFDPRKPN